MGRLVRWCPLLALAVLGGCSTQGEALPGFSALDSIGYEIIDGFDTSYGRGALRRNRVTGGFDLRAGPDYMGIPIPGLTRVDRAKSFNLAGKTVIFVDGVAAGCEREHLVLALDTALHTWHVGDCRDGVKAETTASKGLRIIETDRADPRSWFWRNTAMAVVGPFRQSTLDARQLQRDQRRSGEDYHVSDPGTAPPRQHDTDAIELPPALTERDGSQDVSLWKIKTDQQ